ncbi:MAG: hypothetical protein Q8K36_00075, partial [Alphaproteobacteria bacterium]|nr:hypothetical protein [Alphaproteobacteria bacterium]
VVGDTKKQSQQRFFKLSDHVPVVLGYITYWIGDDGHAYKSDDPYGQDDQFLELSLAELASLDI